MKSENNKYAFDIQYVDPSLHKNTIDPYLRTFFQRKVQILVFNWSQEGEFFVCVIENAK